MFKFIVLVLLTIPMLAKPNDSILGNGHGVINGLILLDSGENTKAAQYFKDEIVYETNVFKNCKDCGRPAPLAHLYIAIADYRRGNFTEAKEYLLNMINWNDEYFSHNFIALGYCFLVASKTQDVVLFNAAIKSTQQNGSSKTKENIKFAMDSLQHAIMYVYMDQPSRDNAKDKLFMLSNMRE